MDWQERARTVEDELRRLFIQAQAGDGRAYRQFLERLSGHLRAYLRRRLQAWPDDVEDLVQEALCAIHAQRHTYRPAQPLTAWVYSITRYKMIDFLRSHARTTALHEPLHEDQALFAASDTDAAEARHDLRSLTATLPRRHREALLMMKLQGASVKEASAATGLSESAVKVSVHRSLKALAARARGSS